MKITLFSKEICGDVAPFLAIAEIIGKNDHQITDAFPEKFGSLAEDSDMGFASLG